MGNQEVSRSQEDINRQRARENVEKILARLPALLQEHAEELSLEGLREIGGKLNDIEYLLKR